MLEIIGKGHLYLYPYHNLYLYLRSPLHLAARYSSVSVVKALIRGGADVNAMDYEKWSPLQYASKFNQAVVRFLLKANAKVINPDVDKYF